MVTVSSHDKLAFTAIIAVSAYYLFAWLLFGRNRRAGTVIPLYSPPRDLSPAMLRYVWKEEFDDRTFWAGVLSLVAKGLAILHSENGVVQIRATQARNRESSLPREEDILLKELVRGHARKAASISMLDPRTTLAITDMADSLRRDAVGNWFTENRAPVIGGVILSVVALCVAAGPRNLEQWGVLILGLAVMAPAAFYLFFLALRGWDLCRAARTNFDGEVVRRSGLLLAMFLPCIAAVILGCVVLGSAFGWTFLAATLFMTVLNVLLLQSMKAPTQEGGRLLTEIEGFRLFLKSVERFPMQRPEPPGEHASLYEEYLPYAMALEIEQAWGDKFVALASTQHANAGMPGAESFYLGMWNGKPLEIVYKPEAPKGRTF